MAAKNFSNEINLPQKERVKIEEFEEPL